MNFKKTLTHEPEINFIPLIDVLLVIIIFLMVSTTFNHQKQLKINLPTAQANKLEVKDKVLVVSINDQGVYSINNKVLENTDISSLAEELKLATNSDIGDQPAIIINADARTAHQSVINLLEAARVANLNKISFLTQSPK